MKKFLTIAMLAVAALGAQAATYSFDTVNAPIFIPANGSFGGTWNLNAAGYNSVNEQITSAEAFFTVIDIGPGSDGGDEQAVVTLDGSNFASVNNLVYSILGGSVTFSVVSDGIVNWVVKETSGLTGFLLSDANLTVQTALRTQPVPDGGSMMALLGLSVLGLGWVSRRARA